MRFSRRDFVKNSVLATAGLSLVGPERLWARPRVAPSDQVNVALIGCKGQGFGVLRNHLDLGGVNCVALCDVDQKILDERSQEVATKYGQKPRQYQDFRKLLEDKTIDAVFIGTPDHWHCLPMVYACQAGKDVYVEKPMANSIEECNLMVRAANRYNRVVQVGQQQRSGVVWQGVMDYLKAGKLGTLRKVNLWANFNYGTGAPRQPNQPVPAGVDYDFWLGPAPKREFNPTRFHGNWRHFWDYGGGLMTDWGVHLIDMALWPKDSLAAPREVLAYGSNLSFPEHHRETFDTMSVVWPMKDYVVTWQHTAGVQQGPYDMLYGVEFVSDHGTIVADRKRWKVLPEGKGGLREDTLEPQAFEMTNEPSDMQNHARNFIGCIKSREKTNCPPEIGRNVALYAHMANIAVRTGAARLLWDNGKNRFTNHPKANELVVPEYRRPWKLPTV